MNQVQVREGRKEPRSDVGVKIKNTRNTVCITTVGAEEVGTEVRIFSNHTGTSDVHSDGQSYNRVEVRTIIRADVPNGAK